MPEQSVVVECNLRVQRKQTIVLGGDHGINFDHRRIGFDKRCVQSLHELDRRAKLRRPQSQCERNLPRLERTETRGVNIFLQDGSGIFRRYLFNLHATGRRGHQHRLAFGAVHQDSDVQFAVNG